jgi:hypothetical protein
MEEEEQYVRGEEPEDARHTGQDAFYQRRRDALHLMLQNPDQAERKFPDLIEELREFLLQCSIPTMPIQSMPVSDLNHMQMRWIRAKEWARKATERITDQRDEGRSGAP